jgi:hypothetical protein
MMIVKFTDTATMFEKELEKGKKAIKLNNKIQPMNSRSLGKSGFQETRKLKEKNSYVPEMNGMRMEGEDFQHKTLTNPEKYKARQGQADVYEEDHVIVSKKFSVE